MKWFVKVLRQYADFKGRAGREEFWMFVLFYIISSFLILAAGIGIMLLTKKEGALLLPCLFMFALLIPCWAVTIRRLHDIGRSAWFLLVNLIPVIGGIMLLVVLISKGTADNNQYGKNPEITKQNNYYRIRSASVALIISSIVWLFSLIIFIFFHNGLISNQILLSLLLPVGLIISGSILFSKRMFSSDIAWSLVVFSIVWLVIKIFEVRDSVPGLLTSFNLPLVIEQLVILIPFALLLSGIYIMIKKTDRTVPACLLFIGSFIWIVSIILKTIHVPYFQSDMLYCLSKMMEIVVPVSLMVFARTMLSKNLSTRKSKNEIEEPVKIEKAITLQPIVNQEMESIIQPQTVPVVELPEKPQAVPVIESAEKLQAIQVVELSERPVTIDDYRKKVVFLREDRDGDNIWVVYKAPTKAIATMFLSNQQIDRPSYYVVVETPEGNFGKDINGNYQE